MFPTSATVERTQTGRSQSYLCLRLAFPRGLPTGIYLQVSLESTITREWGSATGKRREPEGELMSSSPLQVSRAQLHWGPLDSLCPYLGPKLCILHFASIVG